MPRPKMPRSNKPAEADTRDSQTPEVTAFNYPWPDPHTAPVEDQTDLVMPYIPVPWRPFAVRADSLVIDVEDNVKLHGDKDLAAQQASLKDWGFTRQIIVRRENRQVIIGNGSVLAAMRNGWTYVPVDFRDLTAEQARLLGAADNMTGTLADWNDDNVRKLLADLPDLNATLNGLFDTETGRSGSLHMNVDSLCREVLAGLEQVGADPGPDQVAPANSGVTEYAEGDSCPDCGQPMEFDKGQPASIDGPEQKPAVGCWDCGLQYPVDWTRQNEINAKHADDARKAARPTTQTVLLTHRFIVTCPDESTQVKLMAELIERGYECRVSTVRAKGTT